MRFHFLILMAFLLAGLASMAQPACNSKIQQLSTDNKKAEKYYMTGLTYMQMRQYDEAILEFMKAIKTDSRFIEAHFILGDAYSYKNDLINAENSYKNAIKINPDFYNEANYALANIQYLSARYEEAAENYKIYLSKIIAYDDLKQTATKRLANCEFAIDAMKHPVPFNPLNLGETINSEFDEYFPTITVDDQQLLFTRAVQDDQSRMGINENFYVSTKVAGKWDQCRDLGMPINSLFNEGAPTIAPDGQRLVFTACDVFEQYGPGRDGFGSCDLFFTKRIGTKWASPMNMGVPINTNNWESQPSLSSDGRTMYFIRGVKQGRMSKDQDIWVTKVGEDGTWQTPTRLPYPINTPGVEESVFIHPDGKTLYFSSDGHPGMGGTDIYMSRLDSNGTWSTPLNLGYPINTIKNENSILISGDGRTAFFASDRPGGFGKLDIYSFELPEAVRPVFTSYMKGKVYDEDTKEPLAAQFELQDLKTGKVIVKSSSNKGNGEFLVALPADNDYALNVSKQGYLFYSEHIAMTVANNNDDPIVHDVPLSPIKAGRSMVLNNVFFDVDKYDLKPVSKVELNRVVELLKKNPTVKVELGGHTDNQADDAYNLKLSENRAKSVYTYLTENGIAADRLTFKGYGETKPIADNTTEKGRAANRRTTFTIISIN